MYKLTVQNVNNVKNPGELIIVKNYEGNSLARVKPSANADCTAWLKANGQTPRHIPNWTASQRNTLLTRKVRASDNTTGKTNSFEFVLLKV